MLARRVCREVAKNVAMSVPLIRQRRLAGAARAGSRFVGTEAELERHAFQGVRLLAQTTGGVRDKHILEIGPGDFLTSGMAMLAAGARSYTSIDRFVGDYAQVAGRAWYEAIEMSWPRIFPELPWPQWLRSSDFPEGYPDRVRALSVPIEGVPDLGQFDIVCSFQVAEHVTDVYAFSRSVFRLLAESGVSVHRIDFGPHDWDDQGDPLTFLRFPDLLWKAMGSSRGIPNRVRFNEMLEAFVCAGLAVEVRDVEVVAAETVAFEKLARRFRNLPKESLLTRNAVFVCRRNR